MIPPRPTTANAAKSNPRVWRIHRNRLVGSSSAATELVPVGSRTVPVARRRHFPARPRDSLVVFVPQFGGKACMQPDTRMADTKVVGPTVKSAMRAATSH
jgi:hypothetical protein